MIICIGSAADDTFCHTLSALKQAKVNFDVIDFAQLVVSGQIRFSLQDLDAATFSLHGVQYVLSSYQGAWIRLIDIAEEAPNEKLKYKASGVYQALSRLFSHVALRVINPPLRDCSNFSKFYHAVALSSMVGWSAPRSCLTNNASQALEFIAACGGAVIFKGASGTKTWATLYDEKHHAERLPFLASAPVLFQEQIEGPDVRVHIVGNRMFAELIESAQLDYRVTHENVYQQIELPNNIAYGCLKLRQDCDIPLLGIDFKIQRSTGEWFFLEANSMPCYQGYDRRAKGAISSAIVEWLTEAAVLS